jgi:hypothetical protein
MTYAANLGYNALHLGKKRLWPWTNYFLEGPSWADSFRIISILLVGSLRASLVLVLGWIVVSFLGAMVADALVFWRNAIIDENCLTVDMNDIAPQFTLLLTAVPLPFYHACVTQLTFKAFSSLKCEADLRRPTHEPTKLTSPVTS